VRHQRRSFAFENIFVLPLVFQGGKMKVFLIILLAIFSQSVIAAANCVDLNGSYSGNFGAGDEDVDLSQTGCESFALKNRGRQLSFLLDGKVHLLEGSSEAQYLATVDATTVNIKLSEAPDAPQKTGKTLELGFTQKDANKVELKVILHVPNKNDDVRVVELTRK
jgi:hypothetical protein